MKKKKKEKKNGKKTKCINSISRSICFYRIIVSILYICTHVCIRIYYTRVYTVYWGRKTAP